VPLLLHVPGFVVMLVATALLADAVGVHAAFVVIDASFVPPQLGIE
jgi:hypothetical protein